MGPSDLLSPMMIREQPVLPTKPLLYLVCLVAGLSIAKEKFWGFTNTEPLTMVWLKRIALVADSSFHLNNWNGWRTWLPSMVWKAGTKEITEIVTTLPMKDVCFGTKQLLSEATNIPSTKMGLLPWPRELNTVVWLFNTKTKKEILSKIMTPLSNRQLLIRHLTIISKKKSRKRTSTRRIKTNTKLYPLMA